ncbi:Sorting nexin, cytoplasm-to-vacuole targeting pathway/endosomal sorting [Microbotryomycetes sp. JL201]|nr:Sorting nexin, cytoplasm-to-vacuole targeting pathway/endosomal sorting [Microbotryomycetes sp. JL201]
MSDNQADSSPNQQQRQHGVNDDDLDANPFIESHAGDGADNDDDGQESGHGSASAAFVDEAEPYPQDTTSIHFSQPPIGANEVFGAGQGGGGDGDDEGPQPTSAAYTSTDTRHRSASTTSSIRPPRDTIQITDALKTSEGSSTSYIVYCIRFEASALKSVFGYGNGYEIRRRYSDFFSLRQALCSLHPCYIVPPLPPKNSLSSYAVAGTNPNKAKEDAALINRRKRMLATFLNRTLVHKVLGNDRVFRRFLHPETIWSEVLHSPPVTLCPKNPLRGSALNPTDADMQALFATLPLPPSSASLANPDQRFLDSEAFTNKFSSHLGGTMEKVNRRLVKRWTDAASDWGELGGGLNGFALRMGEEGAGGLDEATEKVGIAVDAGFIETNTMLQHWESEFTEPLSEYTKFSDYIKTLLKFRHLKHVQYEMTRELLENKRATLEDLERSEMEAQRLERALDRVRLSANNVDSQSDPNQSLTAAASQSATANAGPPPSALSVPSSSSIPTSQLSQSSRKSGGLLGAITHTFHSVVDSDPEATRRNNITKTREAINQLDAALKALTTDLRQASVTIQADLDRFQRQKVVDLKGMCIDYAKVHREWSQKNLEKWQEAKRAIEAIAD